MAKSKEIQLVAVKDRGAQIFVEKTLIVANISVNVDVTMVIVNLVLGIRKD